MTQQAVRPGSNLQREYYAPAEIAFLMNIASPKTIRGYFKKPSKKYPGRPLLKAVKVNTQWRVHRDDLRMFFEEVYGNET